MKTLTFKPFILPTILLLLLALTYILPRRGTTCDSSISMELPVGNSLPGWFGVKKQESPEERGTLAPDTEFSKADYVMSDGVGTPTDIDKRLPFHISIVKSGHDINNSIHRPERCLPAQGHFNLVSSTVNVPIEGHGNMVMTELKSQQNLTPKEATPTILDSVHYYVFIGYKHVTHDHLERTIIDMKDRILYSIDQRWSYFQISVPFGKLTNLQEEDAKKLAQHLISQLLSRQVRWEEITSESH